MNVYVCGGERLVVSEAPLDQDDLCYERFTLEPSGTVSVNVSDPFVEGRKAARICVTREGRVFVCVFDEKGELRKSYDLDAVNGYITNRWEAK